MKKKMIVNNIAAPIALLLVGVVTLILFLCDVNWKFYLIGAMLGFLVHGMLLKQSYKMERMAKLDPEQTFFNPKKSSISWLALRMVVTVAVFAALAYLSISENGKKQGVIDVLIALAGFITLKVVFIIGVLLTREKVDSK